VGWLSHNEGGGLGHWLSFGCPRSVRYTKRKWKPALGFEEMVRHWHTLQSSGSAIFTSIGAQVLYVTRKAACVCHIDFRAVDYLQI
jgi:hypothetical protein